MCQLKVRIQLLFDNLPGLLFMLPFSATGSYSSWDGHLTPNMGLRNRK